MSCMENVCQKWKCPYQQFSNETIKICPLCGGKVLNFFDEYPEDYDNESPTGDDYEEIDVTE